MTCQDHIGRSDQCTQCGELADFTATGRQMCVKCAIKGDFWTLSEYIAWLNRPEDGVIKFPLTADLDHWAGYGIDRASELADYLDECFQREVEKSYFYHGDESREEIVYDGVYAWKEF